MRTPEEILATGAAWLTEAELDRLVTSLREVTAERDRLAAALEEILGELGVPDENYPAPVANAVEIARAALDRGEVSTQGDFEARE